uniref:Alpha 1,4-glycosyltransferase domain-containing protein n=1 Tax=viral metagenome TaxID=1070528 RepID=A0A6C0AYY4_9ZZZZ
MESIDILNPDNTTIPRRIFQTHKSRRYVQKRPYLRNAVSSWRQYISLYDYYFYTDEMCDEFMHSDMVQIFGDKISQAYDKLPSMIMKSQLWSYCILYKFGGIYADANVASRCDPFVFTNYDTMLLCSSEDKNNLCNWCFSAPAKSRILKSIIQLSVKRILESTKNNTENNVENNAENNVENIDNINNIYCLTGREVFTSGIETYLTSKKMTIFHDKKKYSAYKNHTMICIKPEVFYNFIIDYL